MNEPMYHCASCRKSVIVTIVEGRVEVYRACECEAPIVGNMSAQATGTGGMKAKTAV